MKTTRLTVEISCDAPGCEHCALALAFTANWDDPQFPNPMLPSGWRERRTAVGGPAQHTCSAACERALIDTDEAPAP